MIMMVISMIPLSLMHMPNLFQICIIMFMMTFMTNYSSIFMSNISYFMGMDCMSYGLIVLSLFIISLMTMSMNWFFFKNKSLFLLMNLMLSFCLLMIFSSMNLLLMYIFFEFSLIPMLVMVFGWGYQPERLISGLYLMFYTLFASLPLLLFMMFFYMTVGNLNMNNEILMNFKFIMNISMMMAFLVKLPMYMFHFWLPKAHVQAPVFGSMILAGLLLKIGGYGIIRIMFLSKYLYLNYSYIWYSFSIIGSMLVSLICLTQMDVKSMIAYSSISHMGLCIMGLMTMTKWGLFGIYMLMLSHGLCSSALFCLISISYDRYHSRSFFLNKGLLNMMPSMTMFWFLSCSFNMSCPPSLNFISEIYILVSMLFYWMNSAWIFVLISFLSACFSYYLFSFTQHGNFHYLYCCSTGYCREYLLLIMHLIPTVMLIIIMNMYFF
uniref:NADH-ubiquinone oxidoreductase chain 4 n=1 Tax=Ghauriana sinensis TaxID=2729071 RepID=A0A6M3RFK7_9HEMI|nr:NADH dehydrogenase subunit 4 [Ghauriana sinensis]